MCTLCCSIVPEVEVRCVHLRKGAVYGGCFKRVDLGDASYAGWGLWECEGGVLLGVEG